MECMNSIRAITCIFLIISILAQETSNNDMSALKTSHFVREDNHDRSISYKKMNLFLPSLWSILIPWRKVFHCNRYFVIQILTNDNCLGNQKVFTQTTKDTKSTNYLCLVKEIYFSFARSLPRESPAIFNEGSADCWLFQFLYPTVVFSTKPPNSQDLSLCLARLIMVITSQAGQGNWAILVHAGPCRSF